MLTFWIWIHKWIWEKAYDVLGPDVIRCGNINPVDVENQSVEEISSLVKTMIEKEKGRKHIISAGCEITVNTPRENLRAIREASLII